MERIYEGTFSLPNCSLHLQPEETHWAVAAAAHHHLEGQVERNPEHLIVVRPVAGNIGDSMSCNSDNRHKRRRDLGRRNIVRNWRHNPSDCLLLEDRAWPEPQRILATALHRMSRSHLRSLLDGRLLAGNRNRVVVVDSL